MRIRARTDRRVPLLIAVLGAWAISLAPACSAPEPGPVASPRDHSRAKALYDPQRFQRAMARLTAGAPLDSQAIAAARARLVDLPCAVPDEVAAVLSQGHILSTEPPAPQRWLDASTARAVYDSLREHSAWRPNWIPFARTDGSWLAVESSRNPSPAGPVLRAPDSGAPEVFAVNLTQLCSRWADRLRQD